MNEYDYSATIFDQGIVCFNTNNNRLCIVIDGKKEMNTIGVQPYWNRTGSMDLWFIHRRIGR